MNDADKAHAIYMDSVLREEWPEDRLVPLPSKFSDSRGSIVNLAFGDFRSAALISSARGTVRANHWHRTDWHLSYIMAGRIVYVERPVGSADRPSVREFKRGEMFFTPPRFEHAMIFKEDTTFMTLARNVRSHDSHEEDVVRTDLVDVALVSALVPR